VKWYAIDALTSYEKFARTFETYEDFNACYLNGLGVVIAMPMSPYRFKNL